MFPLAVPHFKSNYRRECPMAGRKKQIFALASLFMILGVTMCVRFRQTRPVVYLGRGWWGTYEDRILATLDEYGAATFSAPEGLEQPILELKPKEGGSVRFIVLEGELTNETILPLDLWKRYLHDGDYTLVSSVDENQSTDVAGIAGFVGHGCELQGYAGALLNLGDVAVHECGANSNYAQRFGRGKVANAAIIVWNPDRVERPACWKTPNSDQYRDCVRQAIDNSLDNLLGPKHYDDLEVQTIVIPALATGAGRLAKDDFYQILCARLRRAISERTRLWNSTIVLLVYRGTADWPETKKAIAHRFGGMAESWKALGPEANAPDLCFMAGISFAIALVGFSVILLSQIENFASKTLLSTIDPFPLGIAWFAISAGLMAAMKQGIVLFGIHPTGWVYGIGGGLSVFVCVPLVRAVGGLEKQATKAQSDPEPEARATTPGH